MRKSLTPGRNPGRGLPLAVRSMRLHDRAALPEETLDALVIVLDEIRLGRARSRGDLVAGTGLSRGVVSQRVG